MEISHVLCHMSIFIFFLLFIRQSGGSSQWRVFYQRGLPSLVYQIITEDAELLDPEKKPYWGKLDFIDKYLISGHITACSHVRLITTPPGVLKI